MGSDSSTDNDVATLSHCLSRLSSPRGGRAGDAVWLKGSRTGRDLPQSSPRLAVCSMGMPPTAMLRPALQTVLSRRRTVGRTKKRWNPGTWCDGAGLQHLSCCSCVGELVRRAARHLSCQYLALAATTKWSRLSHDESTLTLSQPPSLDGSFRDWVEASSSFPPPVEAQPPSLKQATKFRNSDPKQTRSGIRACFELSGQGCNRRGRNPLATHSQPSQTDTRSESILLPWSCAQMPLLCEELPLSSERQGASLAPKKHNAPAFRVSEGFCWATRPGVWLLKPARRGRVLPWRLFLVWAMGRSQGSPPIPRDPHHVSCPPQSTQPWNGPPPALRTVSHGVADLHQRCIPLEGIIPAYSNKI
jgi:hypothetical protein